MEKEDAGSFDYDFDARMFDSRIARFLSIDPITEDYPDISPYAFAGNCPILLIDEEGMGPGLGKGFLDGLQLALDVIGMIPIVGEPVDLINAGISGARGDYVGAALSLASMIPIAGNISGAGKIGRRLVMMNKASTQIIESVGKTYSHTIPRSANAADILNAGTTLVNKTRDALARKVGKTSTKTSGVYKIDFADGTSYVGQSKNISKRLDQHFNRSKGKFKGQANDVVNITVNSTGRRSNKLQREILETKMIQKELETGALLRNDKLNPINPKFQEILKSTGAWDKVTIKSN